MRHTFKITVSAPNVKMHDRTIHVNATEGNAGYKNAFEKAMKHCRRRGLKVHQVVHARGSRGVPIKESADISVSMRGMMKARMDPSWHPVIDNANRDKLNQMWSHFRKGHYDGTKAPIGARALAYIKNKIKGARKSRTSSQPYSVRKKAMPDALKQKTVASGSYVNPFTAGIERREKQKEAARKQRSLERRQQISDKVLKRQKRKRYQRRKKAETLKGTKYDRMQGAAGLRNDSYQAKFEHMPDEKLERLIKSKMGGKKTVRRVTPSVALAREIIKQRARERASLVPTKQKRRKPK